MITPSSLSALLNQNAEMICQHLLPNGKRVHNEWVAGDLSGCAGKSLKVVLSGEKVGVWCDFATGEPGGDLLDLWQQARNVTLREAIIQASSLLHIVVDGESTRPKKNYQIPDRTKLKSVKRLNKEGPVYAYLKSRGLTDQALEDFKVSESDNHFMIFPYLREGKHVNTHKISINRDENNKKLCVQDKGAEPCLFGWDALYYRYPNTRTVTITEGQIDCITLHQCNIPSLSVPNGGGKGHKQDWIENDFDRLSNFDCIYLCMDNDQAGKEAEEEIVRRLGQDRIRLVRLPYKDANECFQHHISDFTPFFQSALSLDPIELKPAPYFTDQVLDKFYPGPNSYAGMRTPWKNVNDAIKFDREELIVWTGFSGSGKSLALNQVSINGMMQGERFVICSLEMPARATLWRMVRQMTGLECPSRERITEAMNWLTDKLWIFDLVGCSKIERILEVFRYAARRYNIRNYIVDSLTKCGLAEDDYNGQKSFTDQLCDFNHQYESTTHLVAHQRKPPGDNPKPSKFGVRGALAITDEANAVISICRIDEDDNSSHSRNNDYNMILSIDKNRDPCGKEGRYGLYYDPISLNYHEDRNKRPTDIFSRNQETTIEIF